MSWSATWNGVGKTTTVTAYNTWKDLKPAMSSGNSGTYVAMLCGYVL
jgi:hypothetical protein